MPPRGPHDGFIGREEFSVFEENVGRRFDEVGRAIGMLSTKMDTLSQRGTNWSGVGVGITIGLAIVALFGWGLNTRFGAVETSLASHESWRATHSAESASDVTRTAVKLSELSGYVRGNIERDIRDAEERLRLLEIKAARVGE